VAAQANTQWAGQSIPGTGVPTQNVPGATYSSESNFVFPISANQTAGLTDFGTRLKALFNNIPAGVRIFVSTTNVLNNAAPVVPPAVIGGSAANNGTFAQLVASELGGDGNGNASPFFPAVLPIDFGPNGGNVPIVELPVVNGTALAVWELVNTNP